MARYSVRVAAQAAEVDHTWLGALLTRFKFAGATGGTQGVRRSLTPEALCCAVLVHDLVAEGGVTTEAAVDLAHRMMASTHGEVVLGHAHLRIRADLPELREQLRARLEEAVERSVDVQRGRPRVRD